MRDARVEPDVEDIRDLFPLIRVHAQPLEDIFGVPGIHAFLLDNVRHALHQRHRLGVDLGGLRIDEQRDRHAPGPLARNAPVRAVLDHAADALLAPAGNPGHRADGIQCLAAQSRLVHADEPLRRDAERGRGLVTPAMRVTVFECLGLEQRAVLAHHVEHVVVGRPHELACEGLDILQVTPVRANRVVHRQAVNTTDLEVFLAVAGRCVHRAGAGLGGDMVTEDYRDFLVVEGVMQFHVLQRRTADRTQLGHVLHADARRHRFRQVARQHDVDRAAIDRSGKQHVFQFGVQAHGLVRGHGSIQLQGHLGRQLSGQ